MGFRLVKHLPPFISRQAAADMGSAAQRARHSAPSGAAHTHTYTHRGAIGDPRAGHRAAPWRCSSAASLYLREISCAQCQPELSCSSSAMQNQLPSSARKKKPGASAYFGNDRLHLCPKHAHADRDTRFPDNIRHNLTQLAAQSHNASPTFATLHAQPRHKGNKTRHRAGTHPHSTEREAEPEGGESPLCLPCSQPTPPAVARSRR